MNPVQSKTNKKKVSELLAFYFTRLQSTSTAQHPASYLKPYAKITWYSEFSPVLLGMYYISTKTYKATFSASLSKFKGETKFKASSKERNLEGKFTIKNCIYTNCFIQHITVLFCIRIFYLDAYIH